MKHRHLLLFALLMGIAVLPLAVMAQPQDQYLPLVMRNHDSVAPTPTVTGTVVGAPTLTPTVTGTVTTTVTTTTTITPTTTTTVTITPTTTITTTVTTTITPTVTTSPETVTSATPIPTATSTPRPVYNALAYYGAPAEPGPEVTPRVRLYVKDMTSGEMGRYSAPVIEGTNVSHPWLGQPSWDVTSSLVAFSSNLTIKGDYSGDWNVYGLVPADGKIQVRLRRAAADIHLVWSPDGTKAAFVSHRPSEPTDFDVFVMDVDGKNERNLTNDPENLQLNPVWSPDSNYIIYQHVSDSGVQTYVMGADGSNPHPLLPEGNYLGFDWSPDGQTLLFAYEDEDGWDIYKIAASALDLTRSDNDLSGAVKLTADNPGDDRCPSWSPGGDRIAFSSLRPGNAQPQIYTMAPDGTGLQRVTTDDLFAYHCPSWSPK